ncbi:hypothetical protein QQZ08_001784 [Neonectria magnoliae]|uniref:histidine kinase n=1 Tax=Neonectria magnoliae TaxID=2732573 RepID=A0ABR1IFJ6_9HYPO
MATGSVSTRRMPFFPKADAAVLSSKRAPPESYPQTVGPIYDPDNLDTPLEPWTGDVEESFYPPKEEAFAPSSIPRKLTCLCDRYLRAFLAKNERLRLSMLWYYTRDIFKETEFLSGLQEKVQLAKDSTGWEFAVIGIQDVNFYIRLATIGLPLAILPRGETICAHTVTQPPGNVFMLPNMMEDWRFKDSPYVESGGLRAYASAPLRLQHESGNCVGLGSLCVTSSTSQGPLTKTQQHTLAHLADWVVSDMVQCARLRRQRERRRMTELIATAQAETANGDSDEPVLGILSTTYPDAVVSLTSSKAVYLDIEGRDPVLLSDLEGGLWEDTDYIDEFITKSNQQVLPNTRVVRVIASQCEGISGPSLLAVASRDFRLVFDDVDAWFVQTCAAMLSQMWQKRLLGEVMRAKEKFLRGISHQLRTPIHGILGAAELLAEELKSSNLRENTLPPVLALLDAANAANAANSANSGGPNIYLDSIQRSGRDLISIVNSMITLDRWADIAMTDRCHEMHTIDELEAGLASEILKVLSVDTRYKASIFFNNLPSDIDGFRTDPSLLRDSLLPLVINAIQHTPEGTIMITTLIRPESQELIVDVEDTGRGIHADHHQLIFEPYEKVGEHSTGAGLGLTLASKFATLLHGSIDLISSEIERGSHFRATFREVECAPSVLSSQPLALKFQNIPSKFFNMASNSKNASLCDYFIRFLSSHDFASSDTIEDSLIILDYAPDSEQHHTFISQIPSEQVAICLVPALEVEINSEQTPKNVVYLSGVFTTSKMSAALEEAGGRLSVLRSSPAYATKPDEPSLTPPNKTESPNVGNGVEIEPIADPSHSRGPPTQLPAKEPGDSSPDVDPPLPTSQVDPEAPVESRVVVPISPALISTPRPTALLVDDNIVNLRIMQMYCRKRGLPYHSAADGMQAVEMFTKHQSLAFTGDGSPIQLILMDLQMPIRDGIEATRQIRLLEKQQQWRESTLFIVTGQDSVTDRTAADGAGADDYFVKPVSIKVLDHALKRYFPAFTIS